MSGIGSALLNSLDIGLLLFIIAVGLNIVFGVLNIINFAHGALYMLGAYLAFTLINLAGMPFWSALLLAPIGVAILAVIIDRLLLQYIYDRDIADSLLLTFAVLLIINESVRLIWGSGIQVVEPPSLLAGSIDILGGSVAAYSVFVIIIGLVILAALWYLFNRTRIGRIMRAASSTGKWPRPCVSTPAWWLPAYLPSAPGWRRSVVLLPPPCGPWTPGWATRSLSSPSSLWLLVASAVFPAHSLEPWYWG